MIKSLASRLRNKKANNLLTQGVESINAALSDINMSKSLGRTSVTPGVSVEEYRSYESVSESLSTSIDAISARLGFATENFYDGKGDIQQRTALNAEHRLAGVIAGIMGQDPHAFLSAPTVSSAVSTADRFGNKTTVVSSAAIAAMTGAAAMQERVSTEAYNEVENTKAAAYSVIYNMQASRQDEFGETFFPTIVVSPDNVGISVTARLMMVYDAVTRNVSGAITDFKKKNILRAIADYTILKNDQTQIIPVLRSQSTDKFVASGDVAPSPVTMSDGEVVNTAPLKIGAQIDLIGISQTDALLASGTFDQTDTLDPSVTLASIYVKVPVASPGTGNDILEFSVTNQPLVTFNQSPQNNYQQMLLNFSTTSLMLNTNSRNADGTALVALSAIHSNDVIVRVSANVSGTTNIERGDTVVFGNQVGIHSVTDNVGNQLPLDSGVGATISTAFANATIIGYTLQAWRTNVNRRQRGQLIDTTYQVQIYNVPLRSPITAIRPVTTDGQNDSADLSALITATHIMTSNQAVTSLLAAATVMAQYVDSRDVTSEGPEIMGVGRYLVRPTYIYKSLDMLTAVDSLTSTHRVEDIQNTIVNYVRDIAWRMWRDSEFKAAADAMSGGVSLPPTVIIGTDPVLANYLMVRGDSRTLGNEFNTRIVSTLDKRMKGKIVIAFGAFNGEQNAGPNPLHFGCMAWKPELTITLPISRNNQISKELTVQPSFLHIVNLPVMATIDVVNLPQVLSKLNINMHSV